MAVMRIVQRIKIKLRVIQWYILNKQKKSEHLINESDHPIPYLGDHFEYLGDYFHFYGDIYAAYQKLIFWNCN